MPSFMVESVIVSVLFIAALLYLGFLVRKNFQVRDNGCAKGCGSCSQPKVTGNKEVADRTTIQV